MEIQNKINKDVAMTKNSLILSVVFKIVAIAISIYGMSMTEMGIKMLTQFTNLSNIFACVALLISMIYDIKIYNGRVLKKPNVVYFIKYLSVISIILTFLVFLTVLAPTSTLGFWGAYTKENYGSFCVHIVLPVMAVIDFIIFDYSFETKKIYTLYAIIPPIVYLVVIVILGLGFGMRWGNGMIAPYNFLNYSSETGWFGFDLSQMSSTSIGIGVAYMIIALCLIFIGLGALLLNLISIRNNKKKINIKK